ncbi:MAG: hypothetical protein JJU36_01670 [Phycisphaeraceae bacterium]|nr:hypothetical protein [Phycisphaeraceae bacterium]
MPDTRKLTPSPLGLEPSFGFGDRLGTAGPGHVASLREAGGPIRGIFAQQSIREMTRTQRNPSQVMEAAVQSLDKAGFGDPWGADADHLKNPEDVDVTADAGFVFFTIDPSDHVDPKADDYDARGSDSPLAAAFEAVRDQVPWVERYIGKRITVPEGPTIDFDPTTVRRAAVKYGRAIRHAIELARYIRSAATARSMPYEIEISVDETPQPTTPAEHYIIADQLRVAEVKVVSLAPRFIGELEKGVDYKGDLAALERSMKDHAAIARDLGPYKLSLHSGSDKLSMYPIFARTTAGLFHVKTAGTSYLEALRVVARCEPSLFRRVIEFSRQRYETDRATYHVSATLDSVPPPSEISDNDALEATYLQAWAQTPEGKGFTEPGRQILHCTFGSVLTDPTLGEAIKGVLDSEPAIHEQVLTEHFARHLWALRAGMA